MRPLSFAVVLALLVSQTGCTLAFTAGGLAGDAATRRRNAEPVSLLDPPKPGAYVTVVEADGARTQGRWRRLEGVPGDTVLFASVDVPQRREHVRVPLARGAEVRRGPAPSSALRLFVVGLTFDTLAVWGLTRALNNSCILGGCDDGSGDY